MRGEFEKRMENTWENIEKLEVQLLSRGDQRTYQGLQWAKKAISDIIHSIDEAKKEFPLHEYQYKGEKGITYAECWEFDPDDIMRWFIKWFGINNG